MPSVVLFGLAAIILWSLVAHRFERWGVAGPAGLMLLGALSVIWDVDAFGVTIDSHLAEKVVEIILAVLLFVDATEVKGGLFGGEGRVIARLVLIGLPLSLVLAVASGFFLAPGAGILVALVLACVLMPTDFSSAAQLLRGRHLPERTRQILNVESGYNDGLISPLFSMALAAAVFVFALGPITSDMIEVTDEQASQLEDPAEEFVGAFRNAVPATVNALIVGIVLGAGIGLLVAFVRRRELANAVGVRYIMLLVPLVAYGIATLPVLGANGFVAAFVAGIAYRFARTRNLPEREIDRSELLLIDEVGTLTAYFVWFVVGGAAVLVFTTGVDWRIVLLAFLALTVLRIGPVYLSLMGSSVARQERLTIGALGPRGTASIVFGLLAYNALPEGPDDVVLSATVLVVVGSIVLHGVIAPFAVRRIYRDAAVVG